MRWIALVRGINVGGKTVPMAELRAAFEQAGFEDVRTYIQSGNVVFEGPSRVDVAALEQRVGAPVILRRPAELRALVDRHPFGDDTSKTHVLFLAEKPPRAGIAALAERDAAGARYEIAGKDVYLQYPQGLGRAKLSAAALERLLGTGTMRNWRTVTKLLELAG